MHIKQIIEETIISDFRSVPKFSQGLFSSLSSFNQEVTNFVFSLDSLIVKVSLPVESEEEAVRKFLVWKGQIETRGLS